MKKEEHLKPLPIGVDTALYVAPEAMMFYHLRIDCPCFKYEGAENLQVVGEEPARQRGLHPCFFCGYEPPPPPTRKERAVSILTAPLALFSLPSGMTLMAFFWIAVIVVLRLYHGGTLSLWASLLVGVGIAGLGAFLDHRFGWIE